MRKLSTLIISGLIFSQLSAQHLSAAGGDPTQDGSKAIIFPGMDTGADMPQVRLYPNPVNDQLQMRFNEKMIGNSIRIYSLLGTEVVNRGISASQELIDVSALQSGLYIYSIIDKNNKAILSGKFNKQ